MKLSIDILRFVGDFRPGPLTPVESTYKYLSHMQELTVWPVEEYGDKIDEDCNSVEEGERAEAGRDGILLQENEPTNHEEDPTRNDSRENRGHEPGKN